MNETPIELKLSLDQVNRIITTLGTLPYAQVFQLIQNIQAQTERQLEEVHSVLKERAN